MATSVHRRGDVMLCSFSYGNVAGDDGTLIVTA
jgi:hypothetical protein